MNLTKNLLPAILLVCIALFIQCEQKSDLNKETIFTFNDGETTYSLIKYTPENTTTTDAHYFTKVVPAFGNKIKVIDDAVIDTIRDYDDPSVVLAIDTLIGTDFKYAKSFPYTYDNLSEEFEKVKELATSQGLEITQTKFVVFTDKGLYDALWTLQEVENFEGITKICFSLKLSNGNHTMTYSLLFTN